MLLGSARLGAALGLAGEGGTVLCGGRPTGPLGNLLRALHVLRPRARCAVAAKHQQSQVTEAAGQASQRLRQAVLLRTLRRSQGGTAGPCAGCYRACVRR